MCVLVKQYYCFKSKQTRHKKTKQNSPKKNTLCGVETFFKGKGNRFQKNVHLPRQIHSQNKQRSGQSRIESDFH